MTDLTPGSPEWCRVVTASKVAAILGVSPWESPRSMWHLMRGETVKPESTSVQRRGHYLEPAILAWWRDQHPTVTSYIPHPTFRLGDWAAATPDAWAYEEAVNATVLVEAKSAKDMDEWGNPGTDVIPAYYLVQVYTSLHLAALRHDDVTTCYVPVIGPFLEFSEYVVTYDPAIGADLEARCRRFYDSLTADEPPPLDDSLATYETLRRLHKDIDVKATAELNPEHAREYVDAVNAEASAKARATLAKSTILDAMGTARLATYQQQTIARRQPGRGGTISLRQVAKGITTESETAA